MDGAALVLTATQRRHSSGLASALFARPSLPPPGAAVSPPATATWLCVVMMVC